MPTYLQLPIVKPIQYFSPTSFKEASECELAFYLNRMSSCNLPRTAQSDAMGVGTAFDCFVKAELAYALKKTDPGITLAKLMAALAPENAFLLPAGKKLFDIYKQWGAFDDLLKEGVGRIELDLKLASDDPSGLIWYGKPDAELASQIPLDWKVNGWASAYGQYPKAGYHEVYSKDGKSGPHKDRKPLEEIDAQWALQLTVYNLLIGNTPPFKGAIDQIAVKGNDVRIAKYRTTISPSFVDSIRKEAEEKWPRFKKGLFLKPVPSPKLCHPYNTPRQCTLVCPEYKKWMADPLIGGLVD